MVGSEVKIEFFTHMNQRVSAQQLARKPQMVDLAANEMPSLSQPVPPTPFRKPILGTTDSFDFAVIDQRVSLIGGKCFAHDATTENKFRRDSHIWHGEPGVATTCTEQGMETPVAQSLKLRRGMAHRILTSAYL